MGANRIQENLNEGASKCKYAVIILSKDTAQSRCAMEEISILKEKYHTGNTTLFPILYELFPKDIPHTLQWIRELIYKEVSRNTGTLEICNNIACKITGDMLKECKFKNISGFLNCHDYPFPPIVYKLLSDYQEVDYENLNGRVTLLYATYLNITYSSNICIDSPTAIASKTFERLFSETRLNLTVDYRELWLLENCICILINYCIESKI